uniref:Ribosomal protein n=1 Tax=Lotharella globosa TaxID=91324 RepID=A0A7S3ZGS7_9EUKA
MRGVLPALVVCAAFICISTANTRSLSSSLTPNVKYGCRSSTIASLQTNARKPSRRFREIKEKVEQRPYKAMEAIQLLKQLSNTKFTETLEVHANLNIDPRKATQNLRTTVVLPKGTGKTVRLAVLCKDEDAKEYMAAGADIAGQQDLIEDINKGNLDFERLITTPDMMPQIARLGRVLGPKGLMPSIKSGTVTTDVPATIKEIKAGRLELRADRKGVVHMPFGKMDFSEEDLLENFKAIQESIEANKPSDIKKQYWKSAYVTSTMGPGLQLDLSALNTKEYV